MGKFKEVAETRFSRQTFIFSAIPFLRKHKFDGLDVDWEYPKSSDRDNFVALLKELYDSFEYESEETGNQKLILSAAVPVGPDNVRGGYDVPAVSKYLDFINLMAYDFHGKWEKQAGHNAPLFAPSSDSEWRKQLSVSFAAKMWTRLGTPKEKLVIGMPTYGRSFTLSDSNQWPVNSPAKDGGDAGEYTREAGFLAYYEVCDMMIEGANYVWDDEMKVPYLVQGDQWVGFDDERSIRNKMDWIKTNGYAGAMVWSIDMDDFNGTVCGSGVKYPLIGAMREELFGIPRDIFGLSDPHPKHPDPSDCAKFYICLNGVTPREQGCELGLVYNENTQSCDSPKNVPECKDYYAFLEDEPQQQQQQQQQQLQQRPRQIQQ